jgi:hypothetical protein
MQSAWRVGTILGIPLFVDASWFFILALFTYFNASDWQQAYPQWGVNLAWLTGFGMSLALFGSVLLHELGHSLVAKAQGIRVNSITLFLFGGIAAIEQESKTSRTISGSRAEVGSSNSIILGCIARERAIATRCCCPPGSWAGYFCACSKIPTRSNNCRAISVCLAWCLSLPSPLI